MRSFTKTIAALAVGLAALGFTAASADHNDGRRGDRQAYQSSYQPDFCDIDHDHRSHAANYYDYYPADSYSRAGPYRPSGVSLSIRVGNGYGYGDRYDDRRYGRNHRRGSRVIKRQRYDTRFRARIILIEEIRYTRRGPRRVCTIDVRGPEARYVPHRRLERIAYRECSRRARVRFI